jgi:hypothetical protein
LEVFRQTVRPVRPKIGVESLFRNLRILQSAGAVSSDLGNSIKRFTVTQFARSENGEGLDPVPGLAGRSPSYLVRQMYDMQHGFRTGEWTAQMKPVVARLSAEDMMAIAAYLSSLSVEPATVTTGSK